MGYDFFLDGVLLPITPSKVTTKIKNQNTIIKLINDTEVNILKSAGLTEISFQSLLPQVKYPFAVYEDGYRPAHYFIDKFKSLKVSKKPFHFVCSRVSPNGNILFDTDIKVSLEDYSIEEDVKNGLDLIVTIKLKQYKEYGTKVINIIKENKSPYQAVTYLKENRPDETSPAPKSNPIRHTVGPGDTLWGLAKKYYGDGSKYSKIFEANRDKIKNPNLIYDGDILTIPALG